MPLKGAENVGDFNKIEYNKEYNKQQYDTVNLRIPKGLRQTWKDAAENAGQSLNAYVMEAVETRMESENQNQ